MINMGLRRTSSRGTVSSSMKRISILMIFSGCSLVEASSNLKGGEVAMFIGDLNSITIIREDNKCHKTQEWQC
jgi:hypothetical protein